MSPAEIVAQKLEEIGAKNAMEGDHQVNLYLVLAVGLNPSVPKTQTAKLAMQVQMQIEEQLQRKFVELCQSFGISQEHLMAAAKEIVGGENA